INVVLRPWVAAVELLLARQAARSEWWIHQYDIEAMPHHFDEGNPLCRVVCEEPAPNSVAPSRGLGETVQGVEQQRLGLLKELHIVDLAEIQLLLSTLRLQARKMRRRRVLNVLLPRPRQRRSDGFVDSQQRAEFASEAHLGGHPLEQ